MKQELVSDWMTRDVIIITPPTSIKEAHDLMKNKEIRRLPVVVQENIVGIIAESDIFRLVVSEWSKITH